MYILGINCYIHDSSACLIKDGEVVAAVAEERLVRRKHTGEFPLESIKYCLKSERISIDDVDHVTFYWDPWLTLRKRYVVLFKSMIRSLSLLSGSAGTKRGSIRSWYGMVTLRSTIKKQLGTRNSNIIFHYINHQLSHAASAFFVSPFSEAAIWTVDGTGEWATTLFAKGKANNIEIIQEIPFPHSLGGLYGAVTQFLGFEPATDEWKVMGLAAYGEPSYLDEFKELISLKENGKFELNLEYFKYQYSGEKYWYSEKMTELLGNARRSNEDATGKRYADIAASLQKMTENVGIHCTEYLQNVTKSKNICIAGGVGLNCIMNGKILSNSKFDHIFIQPAAGDDGTSLGSAYYLYNQVLRNERKFVLDHVYYGPQFSDSDIKDSLEKAEEEFDYYENICLEAARLIARGNVVGWFQGRMEFGPRALGNRSILADPRGKKFKDLINEKVKFREKFRPFAPAVLKEKSGEYFEPNYSSPFMLLAFEVKVGYRDKLQAITHHDGTARVQTVSKAANARFYQLIKEFESQTGYGVILNTSFNLAGEPIVNSPEDALSCFNRSGIDCVVIGNYLVKKDNAK